MPIVVGGITNPQPFAPVLVAPANASYADLSGTPTFQWTYQAASIGGTQSAWALRRKVSGGLSYVWWNETTAAWQSTEIFNLGAIQFFAFPAGSWPDGSVYNWSVATQDQNGRGTYAPDDTVNAQTGPVVTVTAPGGTVTTAQPAIAWAPSMASGASQTSYRAIIYSAAQYGVTGFTPGAGASIYDTGLVPSAFISSVPVPDPIFLANGTQFRAYVQITETGGQTSPWTFSAFTTAYEQPATPTLVATPGTDPVTAAPMVTLTVTGHDGGTTANLVGITSVTLSYSDDSGVTWWPVRNGSMVALPASNQQASVIDYEGPPGFTRQYQALVAAVI